MIEFDIASALIGMLFGIVVVVSYIWAQWLSIVSRIEQMMEQIDETELDLIGIEVELDQNLFLCYNSQNKEFVCQGATVQEIREAFRRRYPDKTAYLAGGEPDAVSRFKTELSKLKTDENSTGI
jgi:hypothetical protein